MAREILRPEYGEPLIFKLGHAPVQVDGIRGLQWRYFVNDDEAMLYLDEPAHAAIAATGANPGDELCLRKERLGRKTEWAADRVEEEPVHVEGEIRSASQQASRQRFEARTQAPGPKANGNGNGNGNGHSNGNGHQAPPPASNPPLPHAPGASQYAMALRTAIDAAKFAQEYAAAKGLTLEFSTEDVRCIAATLYIDQRKEGK